MKKADPEIRDRQQQRDDDAVQKTLEILRQNNAEDGLRVIEKRNRKTRDRASLQAMIVSFLAVLIVGLRFSLPYDGLFYIAISVCFMTIGASMFCSATKKAGALAFIWGLLIFIFCLA